MELFLPLAGCERSNQTQGVQTYPIAEEMVCRIFRGKEGRTSRRMAARAADRLATDRRRAKRPIAS